MSVLTLADAKIYLNITSVASDAELQGFIDSAEGSIGAKCGPLASTAKTFRARGGKATLLLPVTPVISLTSVATVATTPTAVDVTTLSASPSGVVEYVNGGCFGARLYDVAYLAGRTTVPPDLLMAVKEHVSHLWKTQRGALQRPGADASPVPGANSIFTWRVNELIAPYVQPGIG